MFSGTANLQHRFDSLNPSIITEPISLTGDTRARGQKRTLRKVEQDSLKAERDDLINSIKEKWRYNI